MVAASLLWGAPGSRVTLRVAHPSPDARAATLLSATLVRHATDLDSNALTTAGAKTCGVGVVLVLHPPSGCFSVKRTIADGPAHRAGLLQGDILTRIGAQPLTNFPKERLPSLLLGPEGSSVRIAYLRDGQSYPAEVDVVRSVDAAKAQVSIRPARVVLHLSEAAVRRAALTPAQLASSLRAEAVDALATANFDSIDPRPVTALAAQLIAQARDPHSALRARPTGALV
eukprot:CAMPEP_0180168182 /NCGR_PEP_ID=MMETSP0986-20121125/32541_1 /TAXON_ID=697907 /ORGANISM="non described non described, Strain CCMP2293" /LENGTH=227 /DNA_ID=CAMNT_0022119557 /DNA_START=33 /DNA_END=714 /DNA_ORIENTATION=+